MCQCGLFNNCNGSCEFCLIKDDKGFTLPEIYVEIERAIENIKYISAQEQNWTNFYSDGISVLGGEVYYMTDAHYRELFLKLIDTIIEEVLRKSPNPHCRYSTVTNGNYDPNNLLFPVVDKLRDEVGLGKVDINFSYDFKYRFKDEDQRKRVLNTINSFHERYNYCAGIQMILTQNVIDKFLYEGWRPSTWVKENAPGNQLVFLYPHPIHRGNNYQGEKNLAGFNFKRKSLFEFLRILRDEEPTTYESFICSCRNSAIFKHTMLFYKGTEASSEQLPMLSDGKEIINPKCGHSVLYQCYSDTDRCMMCDLEALT